MSFRLVRKLVTLNNLEWLNVPYFTTSGSFRGACVKVVEDVVVKGLRSLSHLLISLLSILVT